MPDQDQEEQEERPKPKVRRPKRPLPQVFTMVRNADETGVSGTGVVGAGVVWSDGTVHYEWYSATPSKAIYANFDAFLAVHVDSHPDNDTEIVWHFGGPEDEEEDTVDLD
jgi:hypothetical protein